MTTPIIPGSTEPQASPTVVAICRVHPLSIVLASAGAVALIIGMVSCAAAAPSATLNAPGTDRPMHSALWRASIAEGTVAAYWPMEDLGADVITIPSPIAGVPDASQLTTSPWASLPAAVLTEWSSDSTLAGSGPLPSDVVRNSTVGAVAMHKISANPAYGMSFWTRMPTTDEASHDAQNLIGMRLFVRGGAVAAWSLNAAIIPPGHSLVPDGKVTITLYALDEDDGVVDSTTTTIAYTGAWRNVAATFETSGSDVAARITVDGTLVDTMIVASATIEHLTGMRIVASVGNSTVSPPAISLGHPTVFAGTRAAIETAFDDLYTAGLGHVGETAAKHIQRLCAVSR